MRSRIVTWVAAFAFGMALTAGCAKQELVKKDETPPSTTQAGPGEKQPAGQPKEEAKAAQPAEIKEETIPPATIPEPKPAGPALATNLEGARQGMILETVYFDYDSYIIEPAAKDVLEKNASQLKLNPSVKIVIEGHCDERGADDYNLALGEKRAKAVEDYLVALGIARDRLSIISYGKEKPADPGHDDAAWARNRRAVLVIQK